VPELQYRTDLYEGTAHFYDRWRPPYPQGLLYDLCERVPLTGRGRLLDLACGTGQVTFALSERFAEVWAVDREEEFVTFGRRKAEALGVENTRWLTGPVETVPLGGHFQLVVAGNAFHRLNRRVVAGRMLTWLEQGGGVALISSNGPSHGDRPWQVAMAQLLDDWTHRVGAAGRVPAGWEEAIAQDPHEQVLRRAGFDYVGKFEFAGVRSWSLESLIGYVFSTSFLNHKVLGTKTSEFEHELADRLLPFASDKGFEESTSWAYDFARKPR
jgi:SAM-dependent methyltransferase